MRVMRRKEARGVWLVITAVQEFRQSRKCCFIIIPCVCAAAKVSCVSTNAVISRITPTSAGGIACWRTTETCEIDDV